MKTTSITRLAVTNILLITLRLQLVSLPPLLFLADASNLTATPQTSSRLVSALASGPATSTDFGSVHIGFISSAIPIIFTFDATGSVASTSALTQGAAGLDFADAGTGTCTTNGPGHVYNAGESCSVAVTFSPLFVGSRSGAAVLKDSSGTVFASGAVRGSGVGPQVSFLPAVESTFSGSFSAPGNLAVDGSGNIYIADDSSVLKETPSGAGYVQSTFITGFGAGGIAVDGSGNIFIAGDDGVVHKETPSASGYIDSTLGNGMYNPNAIALDSDGNIYVADAYNGRVLKETPSAGSYIQTDILDCGFIGTQSCPAAVAVDSSGNLFITSYNSSQIMELTPSAGGYTQSMIGNGLFWPSDIVIDGQGNLYIADTLNNRIVKETLSAGIYSQSVVPTSSIYWPWGLGVDAVGNVYISDTYHSRVLKEDISDPPGLSFAATQFGSLSADSPKIVTLENSGNAALTFSTVTSYPIDFPESSAATSDCTTSTSLQASGTCTLTIGFKPISVNASGSTLLNESVVATTNTPFTPRHIIAVSGTVIGPPASSMTLTSSPSSGIIYGQSVTLTATVTGATGFSAPIGSVSFTTDATPLGNGTLNSSGVATLITSALPVGTDSVLASYPGDLQHASVSATLSLTVAAAPPTFTLAESSPTLTVAAGSSGSEALTITPLNGFNQAITFTCSGLPQFATCAFTPSTVTPSSATPVASSLTIATNVTSATAKSLQMPGKPPADSSTANEVFLSAAAFGFLALLRMRRRYAEILRKPYLFISLLLLTSLLSTLLLTACGGGGKHTPKGSSTITVTATGGSVTQTTAFTLTIQ